MTRIQEQLEAIRRTLPEGVALVAVSKFHPAEAIMEAYDAGQRVFGESRPQELAAKYEALPKDIEWHMIGHLQTNKVKMIVPFISLIHSVDSLRLAEAINEQAARIGRVVDVLFELHIADEAEKFGWDADELARFLQDKGIDRLKNLRIRGLMGMATYTDDPIQIAAEFETLHREFEQLREHYLPQMDILSMGMSGDYPIAIEHGSNMIRVGSGIFGDRTY